VLTLAILQPPQPPAAMQLLALEHEFQLALLQRPSRVAVLRRPIAPVPQLHRAAAVLALGDGPLEVAVIERMVLHLDREALVGRIERRPSRYRPRLEHPVRLQ